MDTSMKSHAVTCLAARSRKPKGKTGGLVSNVRCA
jgi:hypothetical protein